MHNPAPLEPDTFYHIYSRGNSRENIFVQERNYRYFLRLYARHVEPIAETYAYCLLRNHFHFLVRIKDLTGFPNLSGQRKPSQCFSNLFNAYAKAFNKAFDRTGALFQRPFGRIVVTSDAYLARLIVYIHQNPQQHGFVDDFRDWVYSSYQAHLSEKRTRVQRGAVLEWFHSVKGFEMSHQRKTDARALGALAVEDFL